MKQLICITTLIILAAVAAFADIARPGQSPNRVEKPVPGLSTTLSIKLDRNATEAKLVIPKSQVKQLRAELELLDSDDNTAAVSSTNSFSRTQTMISGLFLSLAVVFGGMWFVRSGRAGTGTTRTLVILAAIAGFGSAATLVYANIGPPPEARSITSKLFDQNVFSPYRFASGKIKVETSGNGNVIQLIVPDPPKTPVAK